MNKRIAYRGGLVSFELPHHWVEEYEPEGGGTFFQDVPGSGTLRLTVLTVKPPSGLEPADPASAIENLVGSRGVRPTRLPNGNALLHSTSQAVEASISLTLHHWHLASAAPDGFMRVAIFSYTVPTASVSLPLVSAELSLLERVLPEASFSPKLGVVNAV